MELNDAGKTNLSCMSRVRILALFFLMLNLKYISIFTFSQTGYVVGVFVVVLKNKNKKSKTTDVSFHLETRCVHTPAGWGWNNPQVCSCGRGSALVPACSYHRILAPGSHLDASTSAAESFLTSASVQMAQPLKRQGEKKTVVRQNISFLMKS